MKKLIALLLISFAFFACSTDKPEIPKPAPKAEEEIPTWITAPYIEGGIAATRCVPASRSLSTDQSQTSALARAELSRQISVRAQVMDKTYQEKVTTNKGDSIGSTFSEVSKQLSDNYLRGSRPARATYITLNNQRNFCSMMVIDPKLTDELLNDIMKKSGVSDEISPQDKDVLYQEFKAYKAQQELDEAFSNS